MGLSNIEKKSVFYNILKVWVRFWHDKVFYKNYIVLGKENIPTDKPIIFTPNHQNALMDALALLFSTDKQLIFVARADMFKKPIIASILYFLKILPIYRIRDGYDSVKKSKEIITKTNDVIREGSAMVILPEGNHAGIRRLRPLKKGFARMAFETEEANNFNLDMQIVPVGIDYDDYQKYRGSIFVNFGKPIPVKDYIELYKTNRAVAINNIKDKLSASLAPLIINIESKDNYLLYNELRIIYRHKMADSLGVDPNIEKNRLYIDQQLISILASFEKNNPNKTKELNETVKKYTQLKNKLGLTNRVLENKGLGTSKLAGFSIFLAITLPLFIYGLVNNFLGYWTPIVVSNKIKDPQFQSSFKFVVLFLLFPIFYTIQILSVFLIFHNIEYVVVYAISLPISAILAWKWKDIFNTLLVYWRYYLLTIKKSKKLDELQMLYNTIMETANRIINI